MATKYIVKERGYIQNRIQEPGDIFYEANPNLKGSWFFKDKDAEAEFDSMGVNELRAIAQQKGAKISEKDDKKTLKAKAKKAIEASAKSEDDDEDIA
jgi:hypothetical protein